MMQIYAKNSIEAVELYRSAFGAELLWSCPGDKGGYMHAELDVYGQIVAVSELEGEAVTGTTMQLCFHMGEGQEDKVHRAYEALKDGATDVIPPSACGYSPCRCLLTDKFGVRWCVFV